MRDRLVNLTRASTNGIRRWLELLSAEPKLAYMLHDDLRQVLALVEGAGIVVDWDGNDGLRQLETPHE